MKCSGGHEFETPINIRPEKDWDLKGLFVADCPKCKTSFDVFEENGKWKKAEWADFCRIREENRKKGKS